jgi:hypothetical protein
VSQRFRNRSQALTRPSKQRVPIHVLPPITARWARRCRGLRSLARTTKSPRVLFETTAFGHTAYRQRIAVQRISINTGTRRYAQGGTAPVASSLEGQACGVRAIPRFQDPKARERIQSTPVAFNTTVRANLALELPNRPRMLAVARDSVRRTSTGGATLWPPFGRLRPGDEAVDHALTGRPVGEAVVPNIAKIPT